MLTMYLAGAIRDNTNEDIEWREIYSQALFPYVEQGFLRIISPLGGKSQNTHTGVWTIHGVPSTPHFIVQQDFWGVDKADIIVFNLMAMGEGYPCIGTISEFGRSTVDQKIRYLIIPKGLEGRGNNRMYHGPHPFFAHNAGAIFNDTTECLNFLITHIPVLAGVKPWYEGDYIEPETTVSRQGVIDAVYTPDQETRAGQDSGPVAR